MANAYMVGLLVGFQCNVAPYQSAPAFQSTCSNALNSFGKIPMGVWPTSSRVSEYAVSLWPPLLVWPKEGCMKTLTLYSSFNWLLDALRRF